VVKVNWSSVLKIVNRSTS